MWATLLEVAIWYFAATVAVLVAVWVASRYMADEPVPVRVTFGDSSRFCWVWKAGDE